MKRWKLQPDVGKTLKEFVKEHISMVLICIIFFVVYREFSGATVALAILSFLVLYAISNGLCYYGMTKYLQHEKSNTVTGKRLVGYSFLIGMPIYFLWFVFSLIPIVEYELWLLTGLPLVIVTGFTLSSISDRWEEKKIWFWVIQIVIYLFLLIGEQFLVAFVWQKWIA